VILYNLSRMMLTISVLIRIEEFYRAVFLIFLIIPEYEIKGLS